MLEKPEIRAAVINFNAPELNNLASELAHRDELSILIRPYLNQRRWWERALERAPAIGAAYRKSFGRRTLSLPASGYSIMETGVAYDLAAALIARSSIGSVLQRERIVYQLHERLRYASRKRSAQAITGASHVISYAGFAGEAFLKAKSLKIPKILNYNIAHHNQHLSVRNEEAELVPEFAHTWPPIEGFTPKFISELNEEIELADIIVVGSDYAKRTFIEAGVEPGKLRCCPYGVNLELFQPNSQNDETKFKVVFAGQIGQRKGLSYLLEGYARFAKPDTELTLIGRPVGTEKWPSRYRHQITHVPNLPRPELAQKLSENHVFVFPTLLEGMPLTVVEAMASGLPIIATRNGPDEIVRDGIDGFLIPERDSEAVTRCLNLLYENPHLRRRMAAAAVERSKQFSWKRFTDQFRQILIESTK
jgi:glycosyltransferase involved in cell wall biosynthesis